MGEHLNNDIKEVVEWFSVNYGSSEKKTLKSILGPVLTGKWKNTRFQSDYVSSHPDCNAIVEFFNCYDEWRGILGKAIAYLYEIQETRSDKEVWLVTRIGSDCKDTEAYRTYIGRYKLILNATISNDLKSRLKIYEYQDGKLIEIK
ncbi:MAG: hypothetical protein COV68_00760 [Nitrospirae bacterium CG11_big_fil_rev_8_21_14_0_20_41_14]|nr:MAG: hypothetical protein COV68_00760 [Nitrospirae bacterium CG11_big_fil_rev_8_21_14_0_20_41_14]PJB21547.1 MAG: hypothetical protein CO114_04785 [Euryarchaeota archaeon CG_4_9_14_3_um_filter_38_12]